MLQFFESDGVTPLGRLRLGEIRPGQSYTGLHSGVAYQVVLTNTGETDMENVAVAIVQVGAYQTINYVEIAQGAVQPGDPGAWVGSGDGELVIGNLAADASVSVWVDMEVPLLAPTGDAQMLRLRAYGTYVQE